ncbi:NAD(P)H-binding protein [Mycolicibacterium goodii]|uniref:Nucleoside-diphosphate sugar epimerase n=1 Tax=Mycolicibacterium goodii TaxID=134601 RepID=A0A0K0X4V3_MYCGD|nr:nucleoside-diphosphate sugar epimerase [Mycolicibacterium goodii]
MRYGPTASTRTRKETVLAHCLVTGATGYVGGRLTPLLTAAGHDVRVLARSPQKLSGVPWRDDVEVARGDLSDLESLRNAFAGVDVLYYLVHSMGTATDFADSEREAAANVAEVARESGVQRIVYLGGLHPNDARLSPHLASRTLVGETLMASGVDTVVLQAGVVVGSGSASFEMIRHLTDRLPVMTTPKWVHNRIQPIAVRDILYYLVESASARFPQSRAWDVGGPDVLRYGDMMQTYAEVAGLRRRRMVVLPWLTPAIASWWVGLVTPIPSGLARPLVESLHCDAICGEHDIDAVIPPPPGGLTPYRDAVALALACQMRADIATTWSGEPADPLPSDPDWSGAPVRVAGSTTTTRPGGADPATALRRVADDAGWGRRGWHVVPDSAEGTRTMTKRDRLGQTWLELTAESDAAVVHRSVRRARGLLGQVHAATVWPVRRLLLHRRVARLLSG